ncbi:hypothetical protein [Nonomuraea sp. NPDC049784]|uniref:hypothetical protein n=1 Tax=Nonomuraea sp. NPDC049784 TaxID=3154361 RepID=UPI0033EE03CD
MDDSIVISGARVNNLKNLSLRIPKNKPVVFTGVSGSGKSSVVFATVAVESQRQLNETYSWFIRNRLPKYDKPEAERHSAGAAVRPGLGDGRAPRRLVGPRGRNGAGRLIRAGDGVVLVDVVDGLVPADVPVTGGVGLLGAAARAWIGSGEVRGRGGGCVPAMGSRAGRRGPRGDYLHGGRDE